MKQLQTLLLILVLGLPAFAQQSDFAPSEDVDIHYRIFGSGEPLLIINGGPGFSSEGFRDLATALSDKYRVILYDQRGTGKSTMANIDSTNMTMDLMVKDMEALRIHLGLTEWTILGHSFGGIMANYYTSKHPGRVTGLIASSSGGIDLDLLEDFDFTYTGYSRTYDAEQSYDQWVDLVRFAEDRI